MSDLKWKRTRAARLAAPAALVMLLALGCGGDEPAYGAPCADGESCEGGLQCVRSSLYPGGYCSRICEDGTCGEGAICASEGAPPLCLRECEDASDCRDGYQCWRGACRPTCDLDPATCGEGAVCFEGACRGRECTDESECGGGRVCEGGLCVPAPPPVDGGPTGVGGTPCARDSECITGVCLPPERGGVCSAPCDAIFDCIERVDIDAACAPVQRGGAIETLCVPIAPGGAANGRTCTSDDQCRSRTCVAGQCTVACAAPQNCINGQICGEVGWGSGTFEGCGYAPGNGVTTIDLGTHELRAGFGTADLTFATPPDSVSVTLVARTVSGDSLPLSFYDVHDPRDSRIFFFDDIIELRDTPLRWLSFGSEEAIAMLVSNATSERLAYVHGAHRMRMLAIPREEGDTGSARVQVSALVKRAPGGTVSSGTLDLDVFLVGVDVTAAGAPANSRVQNALSRFRELMSRVAIAVGDVRYHDVSSADATRYQVIDSTEGSSSELAGLFRLSSGLGGNRLAIFLVRSISSADGTTLGIAGGIPGPTGVHGSMNSGVVVSFDARMYPDGRTSGQIMAHEVGHFLGLFHVTERLAPCTGSQVPPSCSPFGGTDVIGDTTRGDRSNLMHWSLGNNEQLTPGQGFVMQRSALVR